MKERLKEQAKKLQRELNKREGSNFMYSVNTSATTKNKGVMILNIKDKKTKQEFIYATYNVCLDLESNIKNLIYQIFENENIHKIIDINLKLLKQRKKVKQLEEKIDYYMHFVRMLYNCRDELCPSLQN